MKKLPRSFMPRWGPWYKRYVAYNATSPVGVRLEVGYGLGVNLSGAILGEGLHIGYMPKKRNIESRRGIRVELMATDIQAGSRVSRHYDTPKDLSFKGISQDVFDMAVRRRVRRAYRRPDGGPL